MKGLPLLRLSHLQWMSSNELREIATAFPRLQELDLTDCKLTNQNLAFKHLSMLPLTRLSLGGANSAISTKHFSWLRSNPLRELRLFGIQNGTVQECKCLFARLQTLETLSISQCCSEIDAAVQDLGCKTTLTDLFWDSTESYFVWPAVKMMTSLRVWGQISTSALLEICNCISSLAICHCALCTSLFQVLIDSQTGRSSVSQRCSGYPNSLCGVTKTFPVW